MYVRIHCTYIRTCYVRTLVYYNYEYVMYMHLDAYNNTVGCKILMFLVAIMPLHCKNFMKIAQ